MIIDYDTSPSNIILQPRNPCSLLIPETSEVFLPIKFTVSSCGAANPSPILEPNRPASSKVPPSPQSRIFHDTQQYFPHGSKKNKFHVDTQYQCDTKCKQSVVRTIRELARRVGCHFQLSNTGARLASTVPQSYLGRRNAAWTKVRNDHLFRSSLHEPKRIRMKANANATATTKESE